MIRLTRNNASQIKQRAINVPFRRILAGLLLIMIIQKSFANYQLSQLGTIPIINNKKTAICYISASENELSDEDSLSNVAEGRVVDWSTKKSLFFVFIGIKNTKIGVHTDREGSFKLKIPDSLLTEKITLEIRSVSYEHTELCVSKNRFSLRKKVFMFPIKLPTYMTFWSILNLNLMIKFVVKPSIYTTTDEQRSMLIKLMLTELQEDRFIKNHL